MDYELEKAREWDDSLPPLDQSSEFEWQVVGGSRKKCKQPVRSSAPAPPPQRQQATRAPPSLPPAPRASAVHANNRFAPQPQQQQQQPRWPLRAPPQPIHERPRQPLRGAAPRQRLPKLTPPRLIDDADNEGTLAWRAHKPPTDTVRIPAVMVISDRAVNMPTTYEKLAMEAGAFVHSDDASSGSASLTFGIWGAASNVKAAKIAILNWIEVAAPDSRSASSGKFPKIVSLTLTLRERANKQWARDIKRNKFRQDPPGNLPFGAIGSFHWPTKEFRAEEVFGMSYEALDPIRMETSCYITFNRAQSIFQVFGKVHHVQDALLRIRKSFFHLCSRQLNPVRAYLLHWRNSSDVPTHVYLEDHELPRVISSPDGAVIEKVTKSTPRGDGILEGEEEFEIAQTSSKFNVERIRVTIANALHKLHYTRAHIQLRLRLGVFVMYQFVRPEEDDGGLYELPEYETMTQASQFKAQVTEEIGSRFTERKALEIVQGWDDLIAPQDALTEKLSDVRPSYSAEFIFDDDKGDLRLTMCWEESWDMDSGELQFNEPTKKWVRLHRDTGEVVKLLDMSLTDLNTGSAWQFDMVSAATEDALRLPPNYKQFADRVKIDAALALKGSPQKSFILFNNALVLPKSVRQTVKYQYMIKGTDYTLELAQFQDRTLAPKEAFHEQPKVTTYEQRWSLNVFRIEWDTMFGKNERLAIGTSADWDDDIENWFQKDWGSDEDGFAVLVQKLEKIEKLIRDFGAEEEEEML